MFAPRQARFAGLVALAVAVAVVAAGPAVNAQKDDKAEKKDDKKAATGKVKTKIKVKLAQDDAELLIEGKKTNPTGETREFETPEIDAGKLYEYTFSATWKPNNYTTITRTRSPEFKGGDDLLVDLTKSDEKQPDKVVVRWVPTPDDIVDKMVAMAKITKDDVVYEPGPGDARMLIAAVKAGAKKGVGIEYDPKKAVEARENVKKAGLADKIEIREGDALKVDDYGSATVILLYMGNEFNMQLRPLFYKQLKPGARIVSHRFTLGDWAPDKTDTVTGLDGDEYKLHIWTFKDKKGTDKPADKPKDKDSKEKDKDK